LTANKLKIVDKKQIEGLTFEKLDVNEQELINELLPHTTQSISLAKCIKNYENRSIFYISNKANNGYIVFDKEIQLNTLYYFKADTIYRFSSTKYEFVGEVAPEFLVNREKILKELSEARGCNVSISNLLQYKDNNELLTQEICEKIKQEFIKEKLQHELRIQSEKRKEDAKPDPWQEKGECKFFKGATAIIDKNITITLDTWWKNIGGKKYTPAQTKKEYFLSLIADSNYDREILLDINGVQYKCIRKTSGSMINDIKVSKTKIFMLMRKLIEGTITLEQIKIYRSLSGVKIDLANCDNIVVARQLAGKIVIPISISFNTPKKVQLKMFGIENEYDWDHLKDKFVYGRRIQKIFSIDDYYKMVNSLFGMDKVTALEKLKNIYLASVI